MCQRCKAGKWENEVKTKGKYFKSRELLRKPGRGLRTLLEAWGMCSPVRQSLPADVRTLREGMDGGSHQWTKYLRGRGRKSGAEESVDQVSHVALFVSGCQIDRKRPFMPAAITPQSPSDWRLAGNHSGLVAVTLPAGLVLPSSQHKEMMTLGGEPEPAPVYEERASFVCVDSA